MYPVFKFCYPSCCAVPTQYDMTYSTYSAASRELFSGLCNYISRSTCQCGTQVAPLSAAVPVLPILCKHQSVRFLPYTGICAGACLPNLPTDIPVPRILHPSPLSKPSNRSECSRNQTCDHLRQRSVADVLRGLALTSAVFSRSQK